MTDVAFGSAGWLRRGFAHGELSPVEVVEALAARIDGLDDRLNAVVSSNVDQARRAAVEAALRWRTRRARPLEGIPVLVKDLIDTAALRTTYGSAMFAEHVPSRDAGVIGRIRQAGGIVLAKAATHEFGWGITTENATFGPTRNPWDLDRVPGGSSGGCAAGLAAGFAPLALGTDTAGSIRIPAAFCGVVGLKPTAGSIDTTGVHPLAPTLDQVGPMARTVADLRLMWTVLGPNGAGRPPRRAATVGICTDLDQVLLGTGAAWALEAAATALAAAGLRLTRVDAPGVPAIYAALADTLLCEGHAVHTALGLWPGRAPEYGPDVRARLELADRIAPQVHPRVRRDRTALRTALHRILSEVDVLLSPVSAVPPTRIGSGDTSFREQVLTSTAPQSLTGLPALTVPVGLHDGLPVAVQLTARARGEDVLFRVGQLLEQVWAPDQRQWPVIGRPAPILSSQTDGVRHATATG